MFCMLEFTINIARIITRIITRIHYKYVRSVSSPEGRKEADSGTPAWVERPGGRCITDSYT